MRHIPFLEYVDATQGAAVSIYPPTGPSGAVRPSPGVPMAPTHRPVPRVQPLTERDRRDLAKLGRPGLIRRLQLRAGVAWLALTGTVGAGMITLSSSTGEGDAGVWLILATVPVMFVAAHNQNRLTRLRLNDPARPVPVALGPGAGTGIGAERPELATIRALRERLLDLLPSLEIRYPEVAGEIRRADQQAFGTLSQQAAALCALDLPNQAASEPCAAAAAEIQDGLATGVAQYQELLAESVLLLSRSEAQRHSQPPLERARDIVATYSEGVRVADSLG